MQLSEVTPEYLLEWMDRQPRQKVNAVISPAVDVCCYVNEKGEHCIVGQFLYDHGVEDEKLLSRLDGADSVAHDFGVKNVLVLSMLGTLQEVTDEQSMQNNSEAWGLGIDAAKALYEHGNLGK
jgi:hypothetical protein